MPVDIDIKFLEFVCYMVVIKGQFRKSSSSPTYKHTERLYDFVNKLKTKVEDREGHSVPAVAAVEQKIATSSTPSSVVASATENAKLRCSYCQRSGHTVDFCIKLQRDCQAKKETSDSSMSGKSAPQKAPGASKRRAKGPKIGKTCAIYGAGSQSTEECFSVIKLKKERAWRYSRESGEAQKTTQAMQENVTAVQEDNRRLVESVEAACSQPEIMALKVKMGACQVSLAVDTGAAVNVLSEKTFKSVKTRVSRRTLPASTH